MLTTVILAPGACWGGSDLTVLAQNRWNAGQSRPEPEITGRVPGIYGRKIKTGCSIFETGCSFFVFFHRCARHPPADPPARRPVARIDEKLRPPMAIYGLPWPYMANICPPPKKRPKIGHIYGLYMAYILPIYRYHRPITGKLSMISAD